MSDVEFARAELWPVLLTLPFAWALLWLALDRSRRSMSQYGAMPITPVATFAIHMTDSGGTMPFFDWFIASMTTG